jgi:serine protease
MRFHIHRFVLLCLFLSALSILGASSPLRADRSGDQLIVLLAQGGGAPTPDEVVEQARQKRPLPAGLGAGNPEKVEFGISQRASGELLEHLLAHPESPRAMLERYLVFTYPAQANLGAIAEALRRSPHVLNVERNSTFELSVVPSDPLFSAKDGAGNPRPAPDHQWGSYALKLPSSPTDPPGAWDYTAGHSYVGIVDTGVATNHEDLRPYTIENGQLVHIGNFREQFSYDYYYKEDNVDEGQPQLVASTNAVQTPTHGGHGTHVAGIIAATANNQDAQDADGVAGVCWHCSLMVGKAAPLEKLSGTTDKYGPGPLSATAIADALTGLTDHGAQLLNMSFGRGSNVPNCEDPNLDPSSEKGMYCIALKYAHDRDVLMVASSGNGVPNSDGDVNFPARHPFVVAAGGIIPGGAFWSTCDPSTDTSDCPSKYGPSQELVAPARQVLSTFYPGLAYAGTGCDDNWGAGGPGYGPCTGTSMSAPYVTGVSALVRSVNPLLLEGQVRSLLRGYASNLGSHNNQTGYGTPDAAASVRGALGTAGGTLLDNRLTPLFSLYSTLAQDFFYTTAPQMATAALFQMATPYQPAGPAVPGYASYPGGQCYVSPCWPTDPTASVYVFTTEKAPFAGAPPLVPLYRMSYVGATATNPDNKDTTYTTEAAGILAFRDVGYKLDGIEGYIYQRCTPEPGCIPAGAVRLYRLYNEARDDFAIFPESELAQMQADGYASSPGLNDWIGYVYPNVDSDGDNVVNGFEGLLGTDPAKADTDCDGLSDGTESLVYPYTDPRGSGCTNLPPTSCFTWTTNGRRIDFNASCSSDDHGIASYFWDFGDNSSETRTTPTTFHQYAAGSSYTVWLKVTDTGGLFTWVDHVVNPVNQIPVANGDSAVTYRDVAVNINVLTNDSDPDGDPISVSTWTQPAHGSVIKNPDGTMRYTPAAGYTGQDSFKYQISDGFALSTPAKDVLIDVRAPNKLPDARDDGWSTYQNGPTNIPYSNLLSNDYDPDGDALTVTGINTTGLTGTLDCSSGTYCRYAPPSWFVGTTSFTYSASDGKGGTDPATVRIKVGVANQAPVPQDDILDAAYNTQLTFTRATLLANDSDPDGDVLSVMSVSRAVLTAFGTLSCSAANYVCTYTPPAGFTGVDVLSYRATDGITFTDARVRILVRPPSPVVLDAHEDQRFTTTSVTYISYSSLLYNDYDPEGGALTLVSIDTTGLAGTLDCSDPSGCNYYRGTSDPTRFKYTVRDPQGNLATATVTLKPGNWSFNKPPVIANDQLSTRTNTPLVFSVFDVLRNDYDPDNDQLNVAFYFSSQYGRVICTTPAYVCTYTPNANFTGTDTLTYNTDDGTNSVQGSVTMAVLPVTAKDAQVLSQNVPVSLFAGQTYPVSLRLKNVGTQSWNLIGPQCNAFRLGSVNPYDNTTFGSARAELPSTVAPGGEVTVTFNITAPATPGTYNFQRRMVHECVAWFGDLSPNVVVTVSP